MHGSLCSCAFTVYRPVFRAANIQMHLCMIIFSIFRHLRKRINKQRPHKSGRFGVFAFLRHFKTCVCFIAPGVPPAAAQTSGKRSRSSQLPFREGHVLTHPKSRLYRVVARRITITSSVTVYTVLQFMSSNFYTACCKTGLIAPIRAV